MRNMKKILLHECINNMIFKCPIDRHEFYKNVIIISKLTNFLNKIEKVPNEYFIQFIAYFVKKYL